MAPAPLDLAEVAGGTRLRLRVKPAARRSEVLGAHGGALKIAVAAAPEKGKANRAVAALLAEALGVVPSAVTIVAGETSRDKIAEVALPPPEVRERLATRLRPPTSP